MGIQVTVKLSDLPESFQITKKDVKRPDYRCEVYSGEHCNYCQGNGCYIEGHELIVTFPKSGDVLSYSDEMLVFDNKYANDQFREELEEHDVPFTRC